MNYIDGIKIKGDCLIVEPEIYDRLTKGTHFQRSIEFLRGLDELGDESVITFLDAYQVTGKAREKRLKQSRKDRRAFLKQQNPFPWLDSTALRIFCDED